MRRPTTVRGRLARAAVPLLLVVLAGCGGGKSDNQVAGRATPSVPSSPATSASPTPSATTTAPVAGGLSRAQFVAAIKKAVAKQKSAHVAMQMSTTQGVIDAEGDVSYHPRTAMAMTMQVPGMGKAQMRLVDGVMYMAMPPLTPQGMFLKIDPKDPHGPLGGQFSGLGDQLDPLRSFSAFDQGLKNVEYVGVESVDGEDMDHYVLTVDSTASLAAMGQQAPQGLPKTTTYDVWLDQDHLMRRMKMDLSGVSMDMTISDWGRPVHITAPPRDKMMLMPGTAGN